MLRPSMVREPGARIYKAASCASKTVTTRHAAQTQPILTLCGGAANRD